MSYGSNLYRKDNPRWLISNAAETPQAPASAFRLLLTVGSPRAEPAEGPCPAGFANWARNASGICAAWLIGLPRRAGSWLHAMTDEEARRWHWRVSERHGGLIHQYRDERFLILRHDPSIRSDECLTDLADPDAAPPGCRCSGDR